MKVAKSNAPTGKGSADWFTGDVYIDGVKQADDQSAIGVAHVRFSPGSRTAWHTHPKGQILYITEGIGLVCKRGEKPKEIRPGDSAFIEPGEEHWHGATPERYMSHVAIQESGEDGKPVTWLEQVKEEDYKA